jgi:spore maturation protein CgeB
MVSKKAQEIAANRMRMIENTVLARGGKGSVVEQSRSGSLPRMPHFPTLPHRGVTPTRSLLVASIHDEFSRRGFEHEWCLVELTPDNWEENLESHSFDLLFVESVWSGKDKAWAGKMAVVRDPESGPSEVLKTLVAAFRNRGIPTVFWNKEDPPNYDLYINTAKLFDFVFTVAEECVHRYAADLAHDRIYVLPFAAQPKIHNPISIASRERDIAFAGTFFAEKHPTRREQMAIVLEPALSLGLDIFDRQGGAEDRYRWPNKYADRIVGSLSYDQAIMAYKLYKLFANVNSVPDSPSMCARRIFELAASNTPVISGPSLAISQFFERNVVQVRTQEETRAALRFLLAGEGYRARLARLALRTVMRHHTTSHRVDEVLKRVGLVEHVIDARPLVSAVAPSNRPHLVERTIATVASQTYSPIELLVVAHGYQPEQSRLLEHAESLGLTKVSFMTVDADLPLGEILNRGFASTNGDYVWKVDDDDFYGPEFLYDLMEAFSYTDAQVVGKSAHFAYLEAADMTILRNRMEEHSYVDVVHGGTMVSSRPVLESASFPPIPQGSDTGFLKSVSASGARIYGADRFNFAYVRHADPSMHTWRVDDSRILVNGEYAFAGFPKDQIAL